MPTIYLDILLILNIYVNFFLLSATAKFTHTRLPLGRCVLSASLGSLFALIIFLPTMNAFLPLVIKLFAAVVVVWLAFGFKSKKQFLRLVGFFYAINFLFAGVMMALSLLASPNFMMAHNSYFYIDFSLITLVVSTIVAYFSISLLRFFLDRKACAEEKYTVIITNIGKTVTLSALSDTGNTLVDVFTGQCVIICSGGKLPLPAEYVELAIDDPEELSRFVLSHKGMRLLPFSTISGSGLLPVFAPEKVCIKGENAGIIKCVNALIGINFNQIGDYDAIFNPTILA